MQDFSKVLNEMLYISEEDLEAQAALDMYERGLLEGKTEGIKEGKKEGKKENSIEIAKMMLKDNKSVDEIIKYTGLSKEEILSLKE